MGANAGAFGYQFSTEINIRLSQLSLPMLEAFEKKTGQPIDIRPLRLSFPAHQRGRRREFQTNVALQHRLGVQTEW